MKAWTRATHPIECGGTSHQVPRYIRVGEPVLELTITLPNGKVLGPFWRCVTCDGPAPPDLPLVVVRNEPAAPASGILQRAQDTFRRIHRRHLQEGLHLAEPMPLLVEREPGEEG